MLFNSIEFILAFLPVTLILAVYIYRLFGKSGSLFLVTLASFVFYGSWKPEFLSLLIFSIISNFFIAGLIENYENLRKIFLWVGIFFNICLLAFFKYFEFFVQNINLFLGSDFSVSIIALPLAISFFTFQQIAYLTDVYLKRIRAETKLLRYSFFVSFFPQLISGPIVKWQHINSQLNSNSFGKINSKSLYYGLPIFVFGLAQKVLIADQLDVISTPMFKSASLGNEIQFFEAWLGSAAFSMQIYFDFAGYSTMAIGLGLMFGIALPINFHAPYNATSIIEFWKRWHITLSQFLRDYLYIPLGGNKGGRLLQVRNIFIVMVLGGLWHGAAWTFVFWGFLHFCFIVVNHTFRLAKQRWFPTVDNSLLFSLICWLITILSVMVGWIFFRSQTFTEALNICKAMLGFNGIAVPMALGKLQSVTPLHHLINPVNNWLGNNTSDALILVFVALVLALTLPAFRYRTCAKGNIHPVFEAGFIGGIATGLVFVFALMIIVSKNTSEFLYFQF